MMFCNVRIVLAAVVVTMGLTLAGCADDGEVLFEDESLGPLTELPEVDVIPVGGDTGEGSELDELEECDVCPFNSGYPCACYAGTYCGDGSVCLSVVEGANIGVCGSFCNSADDCALSVGCFAEGKCVNVGLFDACILTCLEDEDCPTNMICNEEVCVDEQVLEEDFEDDETETGDSDGHPEDSDN